MLNACRNSLDSYLYLTDWLEKFTHYSPLSCKLWKSCNSHTKIHYSWQVWKVALVTDLYWSQQQIHWSLYPIRVISVYWSSFRHRKQFATIYQTWKATVAVLNHHSGTVIKNYMGNRKGQNARTNHLSCCHKSCCCHNQNQTSAVGLSTAYLPHSNCLSVVTTPWEIRDSLTPVMNSMKQYCSSLKFIW